MTSRSKGKLSLMLLGAVVATLILTTGSATAANPGDPFRLGQDNLINLTTSLSGITSGSQLKVTNGSTVRTWCCPFAIWARLSSTNPGANSIAIRAENDGVGGAGGLGQIGVWGSQAGAGAGVYGTSATGNGVRGFSSSGGTGVYGFSYTGVGAHGSSSSGTGVRGSSTNGTGVFGQHTGTTGTAPAVRGTTASTAFYAAAISGLVSSTSPGASSAAVRGQINSTGSSYGYGVWGSHAGSGIGVFGSSAAGIGVYGSTTSGYAGAFDGNVDVTGTLTKGGGAFRIDHPLHPAHKYLQHSFVESPDMLDVYNGNVRTDAKGFATVRMPRWFQALNRSFRYQLTVIGKPDQFVQAMIVKEIAHNRFALETSKPNVKVSWQVTGVRHDRYANAHRIQVVIRKVKAAQGKYLHPELYGKPKSDAIGYRRPARLPRRPLHKR